MIVKTRFMTVRMEDVSAVGRNEKRTIFIVFKSGNQQSMVYDDVREFEDDYRKMENAMEGGKPVAFQGLSDK